MEGGWRVGGGWMDEGAEGRMDGRRTDGWMDGAWGMGHGGASCPVARINNNVRGREEQRRRRTAADQGERRAASGWPYAPGGGARDSPTQHDSRTTESGSAVSTRRRRTVTAENKNKEIK